MITYVGFKTEAIIISYGDGTIETIPFKYKEYSEFQNKVVVILNEQCKKGYHLISAQGNQFVLERN